MEIDTLESVDRKKWDAVINRAEEATIFHSLEWIELQHRVLGLEEKLFVSDGCIFPIFIKKKGPFTIYGSPVPETGAFYGGPVCTSKAGYARTLESVGQIGPLTSLFIKTPNNFDTSIFGREYSVEPVGNFILDLKKPEEELWMNLNKKTRNCVRKAEKSGVTIEFCESDKVDEYYQIVEEVSQRTSTVPLPLEFTEGVLNSGLGELVLAFYQDRPVAGGIFLTFNDTVTYWDGASYFRYREYHPSNLLQWELIKWARKRYRHYDFGGAGIPRITKFKKGWGGEYVEYYRVYREGIAAKAARIGYQKLRTRPWISKFFRSG